MYFSSSTVFCYRQSGWPKDYVDRYQSALVLWHQLTFASLYLKSGLMFSPVLPWPHSSKPVFCLPKVVSVGVCARWLCGLYSMRMKEDSWFLQRDNLHLKYKTVSSANSVSRPAKGKLQISPLPSVMALMVSLPSFHLSVIVNRDSFPQSDLVRLAERSKIIVGN